MAGRIKKIRQEAPESANLEEHKNSSLIRIKSRYTSNLDIIKNWIETVDPNVKDGKIVPSVKTFWKNPKPATETKAAELPLPDELKAFVNYMLEESRISMDEVRGYTFFIVKPLGSYSKEAIKESNEINIKQCMGYVSDRFVLFGGSREQLTYKVINMDSIKKQMGMGNVYIPERFYENVSENTVTRMDLTSAISNILQVNNDSNYLRPPKKGFRSGERIQKNPYRRWILVMDIIAVTEKVNTVLRDKLDSMGQLMNVAPESKQAKILKSFKTEIDKVSENDEEAPKLVNPDDVEDIEFPSSSGANSSSYRVDALELSSVEPEVLDSL